MKNDTHPIWKLIALSIVGGVAKALFDTRPRSSFDVDNVEKVVDTVSSRIPKQDKRKKDDR